MLDLIAFDADDTLWHNESNFQATETQFVQLVAAYHPEDLTRRRLLETEERNLGHFGYGVKGFILSMIETGIELTHGEIRGTDVQRIIDWGHELLRAPVELLEGVREVVEQLSAEYRLMLLTKGDLFDQESKLARSSLGEFFSAVEIVSDKKPETYRTIMARAGVEPSRFVMVGNSLRSDVLPVLEAGGRAVHIPYAMTWAHEHVDEAMLTGHDFARLTSVRELPAWLAAL
ncbi:MAG TPA: HAD family hydrolase [Thermoanaerobaculia bacterium]|jgi:putative hydrolase of the HAD superfamily